MKVLSKTIKIGSKRYFRPKRTAVFRTKVFKVTHILDADGDILKDSSETLEEYRMVTLRELLGLIEKYNAKADYSIDTWKDRGTGYFDSQYRMLDETTEVYFYVSVEGQKRPMQRLSEVAYRVLFPDRYRVKQEKLEAKKRAQEAIARRAEFKCLVNRDLWMSRKSRANLKEVI